MPILNLTPHINTTNNNTTNTNPKITIQPLGAGQEVGRSSILVRIDNRTILFDAGLHMGYLDSRRFPYFNLISPTSPKGPFTDHIDAVIISHFHLDHIGALPYFTERLGYNGPIYMSYPTKCIAPLLLADFQRILEANDPNDELFFSPKDIETCISKVNIIQLNSPIQIFPDVIITAYYAGHVLGAIMIHLQIGQHSVLYTGDFHTTPDRHLGAARLPIFPRGLDVLITESTYATTIRDSKRHREQEFLQCVHNAILRQGVVLIPVFALGRAQELCVLLDTYWKQVGFTNKVPIYLAGNLAQTSNFYYSLFTHWGNENIEEKIVNIEQLLDTDTSVNSFTFPSIIPFTRSLMDQLGGQDSDKYIDPTFSNDFLHAEATEATMYGTSSTTDTTTTSTAYQDMYHPQYDPVAMKPMVILATPGMLHTGLSLEIFRRICHNRRNLVVIPGYCSPSTAGNRILSGEKIIDLKKEYPGRNVKLYVRCQVANLSFSAHADAYGILSLVQTSAPKHVVLVHGDKFGMTELRSRIIREYGIETHCPATRSVLSIKTGTDTDVDTDVNENVDITKVTSNTNTNTNTNTIATYSEITIPTNQIQSIYQAGSTISHIATFENTNSIASVYQGITILLRAQQLITQHEEKIVLNSFKTPHPRNILNVEKHERLKDHYPEQRKSASNDDIPPMTMDFNENQVDIKIQPMTKKQKISQTQTQGEQIHSILLDTNHDKHIDREEESISVMLTSMKHKLSGIRVLDGFQVTKTNNSVPFSHVTTELEDIHDISDTTNKSDGSTTKLDKLKMMSNIPESHFLSWEEMDSMIQHEYMPIQLRSLSTLSLLFSTSFLQAILIQSIRGSCLTLPYTVTNDSDRSDKLNEDDPQRMMTTEEREGKDEREISAMNQKKCTIQKYRIPEYLHLKLYLNRQLITLPQLSKLSPQTQQTQRTQQTQQSQQHILEEILQDIYYDFNINKIWTVATALSYIIESYFFTKVQIVLKIEKNEKKTSNVVTLEIPETTIQLSILQTSQNSQTPQNHADDHKDANTAAELTNVVLQWKAEYEDVEMMEQLQTLFLTIHRPYYTLQHHHVPTTTTSKTN